MVASWGHTHFAIILTLGTSQFPQVIVPQFSITTEDVRLLHDRCSWRHFVLSLYIHPSHSSWMNLLIITGQGHCDFTSITFLCMQNHRSWMNCWISVAKVTLTSRLSRSRQHHLRNTWSRTQTST